jgi:hypothetical protein
MVVRMSSLKAATPTVLPVPPTVTIPHFKAHYSITSPTNVVATSTPVTITATLGLEDSHSATLMVIPGGTTKEGSLAT